jgi:general secretion pathway protein G
MKKGPGPFGGEKCQACPERSRGVGSTPIGFTLVELLIVVTILSIMVAMVVPRLAGRTEQARRARAEADVKGNLPLALDLYELDTGTFPTTEQGLSVLRTKPVGVEDGTDAKVWRGPYLKQPPVDPWGRSYRYLYPGTRNPEDYDLYSVGPDGTEGTSDDIGNWGKGE